MATLFEVVFPWGTPAANALADRVLDEIDRLEAQLTVYRSSSEVSRLNCIAARAPVPVEKGLFELLRLCQTISAATGGAFDVTAGPLIKAWGFYRRQGRVPTAEELEKARSSVGMQFVELEPSSLRVRFLRPGMEINLGSVGKGYALDVVARRLVGRPALLQGGTSSVLATEPPPGHPAGWEVGIQSPVRKRRLGTLRLSNRAMAVSGTTVQWFDYNGRRAGHLLDPRSGQPASGTLLAVAVASSAALADALATAFFVLGEEGTRQYCRNHPDVGAILLTESAEDAPVVVNLTEEAWRPAGDDEVYEAHDWAGE